MNEIIKKYKTTFILLPFCLLFGILLVYFGGHRAAIFARIFIITGIAFTVLSLFNKRKNSPSA